MSIFKDKVSIITGAGSGIGKALSEELSRRGASVVISDVNPERIEDVRAGIEKAGGKVKALTLDVRDYEAVRKMVEDTKAEQGRLDYIFNNAGIAVGGEAKDLSMDDWRDVININLYGVVNGVHTAYPIMVEQGFGHIVNTASIEGLIPLPGTISYVASKYGIVGLSNTLRLEGDQYGVKVSVVCPGYIKTAIFYDCKVVNMEREKILEAFERLPGITPEECALEILSGVKKNKAFIVVTRFAKIIWLLSRISPTLLLGIMKRIGERLREEAGIEQA